MIEWCISKKMASGRFQGYSLNMTNAVLLVNLGSPKSTSLPDIRTYLAEFLMDPYVIDVPFPIRAGIVYGAILPSRPKKTKEAYEEVWTKQGSPLLVLSEELKESVQTKVSQPVYLAMRYSEPSIPSVLNTIVTDIPNLESLHVIPLYPQYAMSTTRTVEECIYKYAKQLGIIEKLSFQQPFFKDPMFIDALVETAKNHIDSKDHLLFSYHGLPVRHLRKTDPTGVHCGTPQCCDRASLAWTTCYKQQCLETTRLVSQKLKIPDNQIHIGFQSRLGKDPWIEPSTEEQIITLAKQGVTSLKVICPSFVTDCLETLEEIAMGGKETFIEHGGTHYSQIPCLNTNERWVDTIKHWIDLRFSLQKV